MAGSWNSSRADGSRPGSGKNGSAARVRNSSAIVDPRPLSIHGEPIEGVEDAQLDVQGDQFVQRPRGHRRGHQRSHAAPQLIEHRLLILPEPLGPP